MSSVLEKPVHLSEAASLQPPVGWVQSGQPASRMVWVPPGAKTVSLHWEVSSTPLSEDLMSKLVELLKGKSEPLSLEQISQFHPSLVRISMESISRAQVLHFADAESVLCVQYAQSDAQEFGVVFFGLTKSSASGEYQTIEYTGKAPEYGQFFEAAKAALNSFRTHERPDSWQKRQSSEIPVADPPVKRSKFGALNPKSSTLQPTAPTPEQPQTTLAEKYAHKHLVSKEQTTTSQKIVETEIVRKKKATGEVRRVVEEQKPTEAAERKPRRRTAELRTLQVLTHILQPGETIKDLVGMYWPGIDEREAEARLKEIYTLNRIHRNICWTQKPGQVVLLPGD